MTLIPAIIKQLSVNFPTQNGSIFNGKAVDCHVLFEAGLCLLFSMMTARHYMNVKKANC